MNIQRTLLALAGLTLSAAAQSFQPGDLYLYTPAYDGVSSKDGAVLRIDADTGAVTKFLDLESGTAQRDLIAYDSFRDRLIFQGGFVTNHTELYLADAAGNVTSLGFPYSAGPGNGGFAPRGDGNIYMISSDLVFQILRITPANNATPLLDASGTQPYMTSGWTTGEMQAMEYHAATNSIVVAFGSNLGKCAGGQNFKATLRRLDLSADGTRVVGDACWQFELQPGSFETRVTGLSPMSGGDLLMTMRSNNSLSLPRMARVNPATQSATPYAYNGYTGAGAVDAGTFSHTRNQAVIMDSLNDVLRGFSEGSSGAGQAFSSGVSPQPGSGEYATLVEITNQNSPYTMTATPLAIVGANGGTQNWTIDFGPANAGGVYLVLGSLHGWMPSTNYGGVPVPLIADNYTLFTINNAGNMFFPGSVGLLDAQGRATAQVVMPSSVTASFVGLTAYHATLGLTPSLVAFGATNAVPLTIQ